MGTYHFKFHFFVLMQKFFGPEFVVMSSEPNDTIDVQPSFMVSNVQNNWEVSLIESFLVTSYPANLASHTCYHHVGFLFTQFSIGKHNKISQNFLFSSYHNTKLQLSDKNINTHTHTHLVEILIPFI